MIAYGVKFRFKWAQVDMQVLMKADGLPTITFANVVDDHLMDITHVIRGEEWIPVGTEASVTLSIFRLGNAGIVSSPCYVTQIALS